MKTLLPIYLTMTSLLLLSCADELNDTDIDPELQEYVIRFVDEAEARSVEVDIDSELFTAEIDRISDRGVVGQCIHYSDGRQEVVIHSPYWNQIGDLDREYLVFHELGHCLLGRDHNDDSDNRGDCISIMQSGEGSCDKAYTEDNRTVLIDELFDY